MTIKIKERDGVCSASHMNIGGHCTPYRSMRSGFSLAEAMMAVVVLGIAAASVLLPFISGAVVRAEGVNRTLAARLASDLMEQIINTPFDQIVSSYDDYSEPQGQVKNMDGAFFVDNDSRYANFSRSVTCEYVCVPGENILAPRKFIRITVQVNYSGKQMATIVRLVSE
jgi:prepilin-type N-terminal cleavage/methylation domain-containing protein